MSFVGTTEQFVEHLNREFMRGFYLYAGEHNIVKDDCVYVFVSEKGNVKTYDLGDNAIDDVLQDGKLIAVLDKDRQCVYDLERHSKEPKTLWM